jgi:hypothetical protein
MPFPIEPFRSELASPCRMAVPACRQAGCQRITLVLIPPHNGPFSLSASRGSSKNSARYLLVINHQNWLSLSTTRLVRHMLSFLASMSYAAR